MTENLTANMSLAWLRRAESAANDLALAATAPALFKPEFIEDREALDRGIDMCSDCPAPATTDTYAGWLRIGDHFVMQTRPMCEACAYEDARARAEKAAS